eukprot:GHUV01019654.1.p1 GENE.GHUV01019654.1~~GHUV01019654.1.p1  ORF type:complete len:336 (+),score=92.41 GHUV01019654.1:396-1403(+)
MDETEEIACGEGKDRAVMKSVDSTIFSPLITTAVHASCAQACDYATLRRFRYAWLTWLNGTIFIKRLEQHTYAFTDVFAPNKAPNNADLTVMEMLLYITLKRREEGKWPEPPTGYGVARSPGSSPTGDAGELGIISGGHLHVSSPNSKTAAQQQPGNTAVPRHPEAALRFTNKRLGRGEFGYVAVASFYGLEAAIKALDLSKKGHMLARLQHEVHIYGVLEPLQGDCIPKLLGHGLWHHDNAYFVATSVVHGGHPDSSSSISCPPQAIKAAEETLTRIHSCGVLHGDIRANNMLMDKDDVGTYKVGMLGLHAWCYPFSSGQGVPWMVDVCCVFTM